MSANKKKSSAAKAPDPCRLYIISPPSIDDLDAFTKTLDSVFEAGDVASFQLRLKDVEDSEILAAAEAIMPVCVKHEVAMVMNDRVDLARDSGADGVHLGQKDMDVAEARDILGFDAIIGVTCHDSRHLAFAAGEDGADYVAFGAFFDSPTKLSDYRPEPSILTDWEAATEIPCVAIGGVTADNCSVLAEAGAHFVATCSGIWSHKDGPVAAVQAFNKALNP